MTCEPVACAWIAVDWGTSNLRAWAMDAGGAVLAEGSSADGMAGLKPEEFEGRLLSVVGEWLGSDPQGGDLQEGDLQGGGPTPVIACGMVGARQGWAEAPYITVPCAPHGAAVRVKTTDPRLAMHILPGLKQMDPPDVMRGEETQIAGFMARHPDFAGALCLPGTHAKWARVETGIVAGFHTVMTGELFALLAKSSVLRHSVAEERTEGDGFEVAVAEAIAAPESLPARLFAIRAADLLTGIPRADAHARLSGLLIGAELAAMRAHWSEGPVALVGAARLTALYARALAVEGITATVANGTECTLSGLRAAHAEIAP